MAEVRVGILLRRMAAAVSAAAEELLRVDNRNEEEAKVAGAARTVGFKQ
jgi:hypothetical protein